MIPRNRRSFDISRLHSVFRRYSGSGGQELCGLRLAQKACRDGYGAFYTRAQSLFRDLAMARADGSLRSLLARLSRIDVLLIDDWAMAPLSEPERRDFWEIC